MELSDNSPRISHPIVQKSSTNKSRIRLVDMSFFFFKFSELRMLNTHFQSKSTKYQITHKIDKKNLALPTIFIRSRSINTTRKSSKISNLCKKNTHNWTINRTQWTIQTKIVIAINQIEMTLHEQNNQQGAWSGTRRTFEASLYYGGIFSGNNDECSRFGTSQGI